MKVIKEKDAGRKKRSLRLRDELWERLIEKAAESEVSVNTLVEGMLEQDLDDKKYILRIRS